MSLKFVEQFAKWGVPPGTAADAPVGLCLLIDRRAGPGGPARTRASVPRQVMWRISGTQQLAALVVSLPAGRGSATPSYVAHALEAGRAIRFEANLASVWRKLAISMGFVR